MLRSLIEDQEGAPFKEWQMPVNQYDGIQLDLPQLAEHTSFDNADDYDNYIARLGKIPLAFSQTMTNMQTGVDVHRTRSPRRCCRPTSALRSFLPSPTFPTAARIRASGPCRTATPTTRSASGRARRWTKPPPRFT